MRIAVLGAGGIGGYYGARLAKAGHDVVLVARGAHLEALKRRGVTVRTPDEELTLPITAVPDVRGLEPVDLLLFCVKAYDTEAGARSIAPLVGPDTVVLTVQNGLDRADVLATALDGTKAVLAGAVYAALQLAGPGVVVRTGPEARITFGERGGAASDRTARLAAAFRESGLVHEVSADIDRVLWEKFLFITGIGAVTALARAGIGALRESAEGRALLVASLPRDRRSGRGGRRAPALRGRRGGPRPGLHPARRLALVDGPRPRGGPTARGPRAQRHRGAPRPARRRAHPGAPGRHRVPVPAPADPRGHPPVSRPW